MTVIDWCPRYFKLELNDRVMLSVVNCDGGYEAKVIITNPNAKSLLDITQSYSSSKIHDTMEEAEAELFNAIGQLLMKQLMGDDEQ
tara:strand:- start:802 stop:1059 length:258 start_codon:yes stop_codon:yes gene_type:complete